MNDFDAWLEHMRTKSLPGGVAAAAVAGAMGAALMAKAARVTLKHQSIPETHRPFLQKALELAAEQSRTLADLSSADIEAYRAVMDLGGRAESAAARRAWLEAADVPIRVAEACQTLLLSVPRLLELCWPAVCADLKTGGWLLEAGKRSGLLSAETNLRILGDAEEARSLHRRIRDLDDRRDD